MKDKPRQRFRSLSTTLPDLGGNTSRLDLSFNVLLSFDPINEASYSKDKLDSKDSIHEYEF